MNPITSPRPSKNVSPKVSITRAASKSSLKGNGPGRVHYSDKYVTLREDYFGTLYDEKGNPEHVKRFTWKNHNKISAQVITYGARITSLKLPNRSGEVQDVVLGFDTLTGYLYYDKFYFGATIGRTSNKIQNATFAAEGRQYWVTKNDGQHHYNGGSRGFDKINWVPYVNDNELILTYTARDGEEGYSGDLFVRISFELTTHCEFKIKIQANCSKITPVDITNMMYFNLAGHEKGEEELKKHVILLNANCYTPMQDNGCPTGEILNVVHTRFDFQTPKVLQKAMGLELYNGYDQNFCINRGVHQDDAFVARVTHPFSGRILEIYSNQYGVNLYTVDRFGNGLVDIPADLVSKTSMTSDVIRANEGVFIFVKKLQEYLANTINMQKEEYQDALKRLVGKLLLMNENNDANEADEDWDQDNTFPRLTAVDFDYSTFLQPFEMQFLTAIKECIPLITSDMDFLKIKDIITDVLQRQRNIEEPENEEDFDIKYDFMSAIFHHHEFVAEEREIARQSQQAEEYEGEDGAAAAPKLSKMFSFNKTSKFSIQNFEKELKRKGTIKMSNKIPDFYKDGRIHGKGGVIYKRYGALSLQTQNYPNAMYYTNFPSPFLKPNETYTHTITYKFWIQSGNPGKWLRRMEMENDPCFQK